eukprot:scaffold2720_cov173-Amphora_coffeaeformis.AAC.7
MSRKSCSGADEKAIQIHSDKKIVATKRDNDGEEEEEACLHCSATSGEVQVRCDECSSYICSSCHWCHEFQANHEIRVCDRCDAFYCRGCDEMDQCDDCGEVVCAACSTLLSCKFCGGGLCEDCATACGRIRRAYGYKGKLWLGWHNLDCDKRRRIAVVASFAVPHTRAPPKLETAILACAALYDCSSAEGTTFCWPRSFFLRYHIQRVSSRSIDTDHCLPFFALKTNDRCGIVLCQRDAKFAVDCDTCRLSYCLVCLASGNKDPCVRCNHRPSKRMEQLVHLRLKSIYKAFKQSSNSSALGASARSLKKNDLFPDDAPTEDAEALMMAAAAASALTPSQKTTEPRDKYDRTSRISEHKVSKEEYAKKVKRADDAAAALLAELDEEEQVEKSKKSKKKKKKKKEKQHAKQEKDTRQEEDASSSHYMSSFNEHDKGLKELQDDNDSHSRKSSTASLDAYDEVILEEHLLNSSITGTKDAQEVDFERLEDMEDVEGLEGLLLSVKGVPGKAALRKNIKKALKRLRVPPEQQGNTPAVDDSAFIPVEDHLASHSQEVCSGAETPVQNDDDPRVAELLQIVSYTHNKTPNGGNRTKIPNPKGSSECIMNMAPTIVGWVIGKGGQRIRDLMEESGARIWIDQESMKPQDPRVVYVSGSRKNVDSATRMIKDLIAKTPAETPKSLQSTPVAEASNGNSNNKGITTTGEKGPGVPKDFSSGGTTFQLQPRETLGVTSTKTKHEMTCDPRFVPLLIGRRGWTIKNIQDSSGARIDIDQTVTPRKITISGDEKSVEIAKGMVGDVLSYPQSQLHGAGGEGDPYEKPAIVSGRNEKQEVVRALANPVSDPVSPTPPLASSPPPATEIVAGDGKDIVSASSSLSSTPEPTVLKGSIGDSLHSSSTRNPGLPSNPMGTYHPGPINNNPFAHDSAHDVLANKGAAAPAFPSSTTEVPFGQGGHLYGHSHAHAIVGQSFERSAQGQFPPVLGKSGPTQFTTSAFQAARQAPTVPLVSPVANRPVVDARTEADNVLPDIWNPSRTIPGGDPGGSGEFGLAAAVDFLQHSQPPPRPMGATRPDQPLNDIPPLPSSLSGVFQPGRPLTTPPTIGQSSMFNTPAVRDDSNIVDSLFGPAEPSRGDVGLIAGLEGLAIGPSTEVSSLWANGGDTDNETNDILGLDGLLSDPEPSAGFSEPDHSRFAWGSSR